MADPKGKATRLSVSDFGGHNGGGSVPGSGIIFMDGCDFPDAFTFGSPGILDGVAFCVCTAGNVTLKVNSRLYGIDSSTAIVIMPNHIVEPVERSADLAIKLVILSLDYFAGIKLDVGPVTRLEQNPCVGVSDEDKDLLTDMFLLVGKLLRTDRGGSNNPALGGMVETIVYKFETIIADDTAQAGSVRLPRAEEITQQFLKMVIARYKESRSVDDYAAQLCVSPKYLTEVVRRTTGETPFEWINKIVIIGAKNLIRTKDQSILQISEELNFPNPSFFGRYFKKHSGMTPLEFRKSR